MDKMQESYDSNIKSKCIICENQKKITDLWEPRWQWDMKGLLCKTCFDNKEGDFKTKKEICVSYVIRKWDLLDIIQNQIGR